MRSALWREGFQKSHLIPAVLATIRTSFQLQLESEELSDTTGSGS
jgi:hypothetical protein